MAQVSDGVGEKAPERMADPGPHAIGVPSAGLSLGWMLASRANLRFTRRVGDTAVGSRKQERPEVAGQEDLHESSEGSLVFCPKHGVHFSSPFVKTRSHAAQLRVRTFEPSPRYGGLACAESF